jgi:hypothetical protein
MDGSPLPFSPRPFFGGGASRQIIILWAGIRRGGSVGGCMLSYDVRIALGKTQRSSACRMGGGGRGRYRETMARRLYRPSSLSPGIIRTRRTIRHDAVPGEEGASAVCGCGISTAIGSCRRSFDVDVDP